MFISFFFTVFFIFHPGGDDQGARPPRPKTKTETETNRTCTTDYARNTEIARNRQRPNTHAHMHACTHTGLENIIVKQTPIDLAIRQSITTPTACTDQTHRPNALTEHTKRMHRMHAPNTHTKRMHQTHAHTTVCQLATQSPKNVGGGTLNSACIWPTYTVSFCPSVRTSVCRSIRPPVCLPTCHAATEKHWWWSSMCSWLTYTVILLSSVRPSAHMSIHPSACLLVCLPTCCAATKKCWWWNTTSVHCPSARTSACPSKKPRHIRLVAANDIVIVSNW